MSQHTPGPYRAAKQDYQWYVQSQHVRHPNGSGNWADVATVSYVNGCGEPEARLFAAAPDLLEALTLFVQHFGDPFKCARAALAKAQGEGK